MCGIVGVAIKKNYGFFKKEEDVFYDLLFADTLRGDDSTGMVFVEKDGSFGIVKDRYSAPLILDEFRNTNMGKSMLQLGKAMIGHNRKATIGKVEKDTAHPFVVDDVFALVHNGTLHGHKQLADTAVDSEALAIHLKKVLGPDYTKEAFEKAIGKVYGAYAVACFNQETNKLHLFRNSQRPLCIVETDEAWFWASEYGMLSWILSRHSITIKKDAAEFVKEDTLYTIDLTDNKLTKEAYTPKKYTAVTNNTPMVIGTKVTVATGGLISNGVSKNEFKRLKKQLAFKQIQFFADDYVEKNFPKLIESGETELCLFGELLDDEYKFYHSIQAYIDLKQHPSLQDGRFTNKLYSGRIFELSYDSAGGGIIVHVDHVLPMPSSLDKKPTIIDDTWINKKLDEQDKNETALTLLTIH